MKHNCPDCDVELEEVSENDLVCNKCDQWYATYIHTEYEGDDEYSEIEDIMKI